MEQNHLFNNSTDTPGIVTLRHNLLRKKCNGRDVTVTEANIYTKQAEKAIAEYRAVGISAPQLGFNFRAISIALSAPDDIMRLRICSHYFNPVITKSEGSTEVVEGCLSIPGVYGKVVRSTYIELDYQDIDGKAESANFFGIEAIVIQHEIDHLDGVLFIDKASDLHIDFKK